MSEAHEEVGQRFTHVLLDRVHTASTAADLARVDRAMRTLREEAAPPARAPSFVGRVSWLAAAALVLAVAWWSTGPGASVAAAAVVERALETVRVSGDRHYRLTAQLSGGEERRVADLYLRGGDRFTARLPRRGGGVAWAGYDGSVAWRVPAPPRLPVRVSDDAALVRARLGERGTDLPFLELESALVAMRDRFDLSDVAEPPLGGAPDPTLHYVRATARDDTPADLPAQIDLAVRRRDGVVEALVVTPAPPHPARRIVFRLLDEEPRADRWYGFEAHTEPGRDVRRF
ncbi:MAG: hypothetical protein AAF726_22515 [Planctomycetota bacterium]